MASRNKLPIDAVLALAVFAVALVLLAVGEGDAGAAAIALTALASLPVAARRRAPLSVFVVTTLASAAVFAVATPGGPPVGPTVALFGLAAGVGRSKAGTPLTLAVVVSMFAVHLTAAGMAEGDFPLTSLLFGVVLWTGVWLAGERVRVRAERLEELEERAERAERDAERERQLAAAEERMRIARDLHDSAGHAINVILVHAGLGRLRTERDPEGARAALETIEDVARQTVGEIDQLVGVLRDESSAGDGAADVEPTPGLAALDGLVERHRAAGMDVRVTTSGSHRPLPPGVDRGAYRILQEALTNAMRHGNGSARVDIAYGSGAVELTVDNPRGSEPAGASGHGVVGMRERAALLGGTLEAGPHEGRFRVHAVLPLARRPQ